MDEILNQRYQLTKKLGQGGFGAVYQATDLVLDREVAVKLLTFTGEEQEELTRRFITEARIASKLNHPNALIIYDFGDNQNDGRCFLVSELLVGESLHDRLTRGRLPIPLALEVLHQIATVLAEAHKLKIVHRDIKPANIFLNDQTSMTSGFVKLLDFGIAKLMEGKSNTVTGQMMGTPHYMSPQQIVNIKLVDHRTDIYSLGIVFFHALMGYVPFNDESYYAIMRQHMQSPMPPLVMPTEVSTPLANALQRLVTEMTHKDHQKRIASGELIVEMVQDIWARFPETRRPGNTGMYAAITSAPPASHTPPQASPLPAVEPLVEREGLGLSLDQTPLASEQPQEQPQEKPQEKPQDASPAPVAPSPEAQEKVSHAKSTSAQANVRSETILKPPAALPPQDRSKPWLLIVAGVVIASAGALWALTTPTIEDPIQPTVDDPAQPVVTLDAGVKALTTSAQAAGEDQEPPQADAEPSRAGAEPSQAGAETPQAGAEPPQAGAETSQAGAETPQAGAETPQAGVETPQAGVETPQAGVETPQNTKTTSTRTKRQKPRSRKPAQLKLSLSKVRPAYDVGESVKVSWRVKHASQGQVFVEVPPFATWQGRTRGLKRKDSGKLTFKGKGKGTLKVCLKQGKNLTCDYRSLKVTAIDSIFQGP